MARRKIDKAALANLIRNLDGLDNEQRADLLQLLNEQKRYGLVWEDHIEDAEELLREKLPVFIEDKDKRLDKSGQDAPNHVLIEGDNLHALTALSYTHEGMVDVIYIDPPYNTGNKDFVYNDSYVDTEDGYRHSKWLSFMEKRLRIAKRLLSDHGVIFISIDDNEQANLKLLCDEVFGNRNSLGEIIWETATDNNPTQISIDHEYVLCFAKAKENLNKWTPTSEKALYIQQQYLKIKKSGVSDLVEIRRLLKNWINNQKKTGDLDLSGVSHYDYVDEKGVFYPGNSANTKPGDYTYDIIHPITGKVCAKPNNGYRWPSSTFWAADKNGDVLWGEDETTIPKIKKRVETATELLKSYYYEDGRAASKLLDDILQARKFNNPKPISLIKKLIRFSSFKDSIILDFFAGSGTTLHATMQLNAEDGGHRQCILVTNKENNICEEVTYERNKRVIKGYTTPKGEHVEGLKNNNLRYYKTEFVNRAKTSANMKELMKKSLDILCIKEGLYKEKESFEGLKLAEHIARYYTDGTTTPSTKQMLIIYEPAAIPVIVKRIEKMQLEGDNKLLVYVMSDGQYPFTEDFASVLEKIKLYAMPYALYQAMRQVLPTPNAEEAEEQDIEVSDEEADSSIYKTDEE